MKETRYKKGDVFRALKDLPYTFVKGSVIIIDHIDFGSSFYYEVLTNCYTYFKADDDLMNSLTEEGYIETESKMLKVTKNVVIGNISFNTGELIAGLKLSSKYKDFYEFYKISSDLSGIESRTIPVEIFDLFRKIAPSAIIEESEEPKKDDGCEVRRHSDHVEYYKHDRLHRDNDLPAVEYVNGDKFWYKDGKLHRDNDLPAAITTIGNYWYVNNKLHRENDLPAIESVSGYKAWCKNGEFHREGGMPAVILSNGEVQYWIDGKLLRGNFRIVKNSIETSYYKDGKRHRDNDLPAVEGINGFKAWYKDGRLHREGGKPAVIHSNGNKEYWIDGKKHCPPTMTEIYLLVYGDEII